MQIFAAKHTFVRNARLRSIILQSLGQFCTASLEWLPTISRNNWLVTAEGAPF